MAQTRGRKTSSKRKTNNRGKSKRNVNDRFENTVIDEVFFLVSIAVTILLFLCNFNLIGKVGEVLSNIMFGLFGYMAYVAPLLIFFAFYFGLANMGNRVATIKLISGTVLFCRAFPGLSASGSKWPKRMAPSRTKGYISFAGSFILGMTSRMMSLGEV